MTKPSKKTQDTIRTLVRLVAALILELPRDKRRLWMAELRRVGRS